MEILDKVIGCEIAHPQSIVFDAEENLNRTFVVDKICHQCNALNYCSDFLQNRYTYKTSLLEHLTKQTPEPKIHLCDWCGFLLMSKNDKNYFCKGCGRTIHLEGLNQVCTKTVNEYKVPPTVAEIVKEKAKPRIAPHVMVAEGEPRQKTKVSSPKNGLMQEQYNKIKEVLKDSPLTYNEIVEAVPDLKAYKKPLNSLWSIMKKYGREEVESTGERPTRLRLKVVQ